MRMGSSESIHVFPVESMTGESIDEVFVGFSGLLRSRGVAFVGRDPSCNVVTLGAENAEVSPRVLRQITAEHWSARKSMGVCRSRAW